MVGSRVDRQTMSRASSRPGIEDQGLGIGVEG